MDQNRWQSRHAAYTAYNGASVYTRLHAYRIDNPCTYMRPWIELAVFHPTAAISSAGNPRPWQTIHDERRGEGEDIDQ